MIRRSFAKQLVGGTFLGTAGAYLARAAEAALLQPGGPGRRVPGHPVLVSMYSTRLDGARTASGERFDSQELTTAHRALRFGTLIRLTNPANQQSVVVRVNDRGPFIRGRELDITARAAKELGVATSGLARLMMHVIDQNSDPHGEPDNPHDTDPQGNRDEE